ncbi:DUF397 domain-containing protein [Actinomadura oligospora]|uniref:DUF397 domain-containing protein n=1 Tax=Actinomadura oligospora TaxID=111804 RepID=UPI00047ADFFD|nr:DUF397 domain-containing protein [Actinomadura oligospora]
MSVRLSPRGVWRKSTHSTPNGSDCVEVADVAVAKLVRDSKDPEGPMLSVSSADWRALVVTLKDGTTA